MNHPEWSKENSLTSPEDRVSTKEKPWRPEQGAPSLTEHEVNAALEDLNNDHFVKRFPTIDRTYSDPAPAMQNIGLLSFVPAKGATPNANGIYGFAKLRGNFATDIEANQRAEFLIRNCDSYHQIYHTYVGRPFPLTASSKYSKDVTEIDLQKHTSESISADVKHKKESEKQAMQDIKNRETELLEQSRKIQKGEDVSDPYDEYITMKVKKAQLSWTYLEHQKKLEEVVDALVSTIIALDDADVSYPEFKDSYFEKYKKAREDAGFKDTDDCLKDSFMKFMVEDANIPIVNERVAEHYKSTV